MGLDLGNLSQASRRPILRSLRKFAGRRVSDWMRQGHPAGSGQLLNANGQNLRNYRLLSTRYPNQDLVDLLAATGPTHCMDGWTYLGRAMECVLSGNLHPARHLAYYAQLRAALSILANCGIGVFNTINFVVGSNGGILRLDNVKAGKPGMGTHLAVWRAIEGWAHDSSFANEFLDSIRVGGVTLNDCVQSIWPSASPNVLVADVVRSWGLDLRQGAADQEHRNVSSYVVHDLNRLPDAITDRLNLVNQIWECLEPSSGNGYDALDRFLLRKFLHTVHYQIHGDRKYERGNISRRYGELDPRVQSFASLDFLTGKTERQDADVMKRAATGAGGKVDGMICRAVLLLRAAVGFTQGAFLAAGLGTMESKVRPWLEVTGEDKGFWPSQQPPAQMGELWDVVSNAVDDLNQIVGIPPRDQYDWWANEERHLGCLSQAERACMWGMCS